jgi:hypothetical protein
MYDRYQREMDLLERWDKDQAALQQRRSDIINSLADRMSAAADGEAWKAGE